MSRFPRIHSTKIFQFFLLIGVLALGGCATTSPDNDPYEGVNRKIMDFNLSSDRYVLKPIAKTYDKLPNPVKNGVGNFFSNLLEPYTILNDLLQGKFRKAGRDTGRFVINTTIGLLGLSDPATEMGLEKQREDFGQTLAVWGVPSGPYLVLPIFGPSNLRDTVGLIPAFAGGDPVSAANTPERYWGTGLRLVNVRAGLLPFDDVLELQPDKYVFLREAYRQRRQTMIADGQVDTGAQDEELLDELLDEDTQ
ncbi:MAG: VacJ family lipoprotein [Pseudomonadota bacterium]